MKKYIVSTALALAVAVSSAEARDISTGTIMVTGDTNIDISSNEISGSGVSTTTDTTKVNVAGAYFLAPNLGAGLLLSSENSEVDDGSTVSKQKMTMIGPIVGYNVSLNQDSGIMLEGAIFYVDGELDEGAFNADISGNGFMIGAAFNYFITDNIATTVGLRAVRADVDLSSGGNTLSADLDETGANLGMSLFF